MIRIWVHSLLPGVRRRIASSSQRRSLYLTFDDGPHPSVTPEVLGLLQKYGAHATFFLVGQKAIEHRSLAREIVAAGHLLGNHSFTHRRFSTLPQQEQWSEVMRANEALAAIDEVATHPFRPPYGVAPLRLLHRLARAGIRTEYWSVDSHDFKHNSQASVTRLQPGRVRAGDLILLHDDHSTVLEVLRSCLPVWAEAGFQHPTTAEA